MMSPITMTKKMMKIVVKNHPQTLVALMSINQKSIWEWITAMMPMLMENSLIRLMKWISLVLE